MNAIKQQEQEAVQTAELIGRIAELDQPFDLHKEYQSVSTCGYNTDMTLCASELSNIAATLRGITAINAVMMAESADGLKIGAYLRGGLHDAIDALADCANSYLEQASTRNAKQRAKQ